MLVMGGWDSRRRPVASRAQPATAEDLAQYETASANMVIGTPLPQENGAGEIRFQFQRIKNAGISGIGLQRL
jgi:hypothetical protein